MKVTVNRQKTITTLSFEELVPGRIYQWANNKKILGEWAGHLIVRPVDAGTNKILYLSVPPSSQDKLYLIRDYDMGNLKKKYFERVDVEVVYNVVD